MKNRASNAGGVTFDQIFRAIGYPHRLQILLLLHERELSAGEILKALDVVQSTLSHHMKCLVDSGTVTASRHGKWTYYSLNTEVLKEAVSYLDQFTEGTKVRAQFEQGTVPVVETAELSVSDLSIKAREDRKEMKLSKEKAEKANVSVPDNREEKKKSKKGKKGKKNKK